jgi:hypothetical protein
VNCGQTPSNEEKMPFSPEIIVRLLEKSVDFVKLGKDERKRFFQEVIAPLYEETEAVVRDYHRLWADVMPIATEMAHAASIDATAEAAMKRRVDDQRETCLIQRRKLHGIAKRLESSDEIAVQEFGRRINEIFAFQTEGCAGVMSAFGRFCEFQLVESNVRLEGYQSNLALALSTIAERQRAVRTSWVQLSDLYANLQLRAFGR